MAKKSALFEKTERKAPVENETEKQERLRRYEAGYIFRKDMQFYPDVTKSWREQVLELEARGKPTSITAHELAAGYSREPGSDDE